MVRSKQKDLTKKLDKSVLLKGESPAERPASYMTKDELQKLYEDLEQEEKRLKEQLSKIADPNPAVKNDSQVRVPNYGEDEEENAMEATDLDINFALVRELETKLNEILKTKEKIKNGTYGKCESCSVEIPPARLKARPIAALCISCAKSGK